MTIRVGVEAYTLSIRRTGIGWYVANLLIAAARPGLALTAMIYPGEPSGPPELDDLTAAGIAIRRPSRLSLRVYLKLARLGRGVPFQLLAGRHDVFLFTNYRRFPTRGRPVISFVYDLGFQVVPDCVDPDFIEELRRNVPELVDRSDRIGVISQSMAREMAAAYPDSAERLVVMTPAVTGHVSGDPPDDWRARLAAHNLSPNYVLHVGTLEPRKNVQRLVEATEMLPECQLVLVGGSGWSDGPIRAAIAQAGDRVRHIPYVSGPDLRALYEGATLFAFPSLYEGFGMPVLEAMAAGVPVLCADIPVLREAGGEAASYVDPLDTDAIAGGIEALLADPVARERMIEQGRTQVTRFSWQRSANTLASEIEALAR